ncbi:MAG TPA: fused MFS/spermidine synthase [bacterium]|nr:fused MFS/spermidine synthase [bacterium]
MTLRVVVFGAGAVLMALEIVGSRILAPYFGSSVYVWGSLISIFLAALSAGYYLGGVASDRWPQAVSLAVALTVSGALILMLPVASRPILETVTLWDLGPRASPLLASVVLFVLPSLLLGMTSPFAIKLAATDLATVGATAGVLYAISTAGSIAGTLLTAFVLIPAMGVRAILYTLGVTLVVLAGLLALRAVRRVTPVMSLLLVGVLAWEASAATVGISRWLVEKDTVYHRIRVHEDVSWRYLRFDRSLQGGMLLKDPTVSPLRYTDYVHLAWVFTPSIRRVLVIGLGAGSIPKQFLATYPAVSVESVELDPVVVDVARQYFAVPAGGRHRIIVQDGRQYVRRADGVYDMILVDAYFADAIPFHLVTREFLGQLKAHLAPGGVVVANIVGALGGANSKLFRSVYKTYASEFGSLAVFPVGFAAGKEEATTRTILLFATPTAGLPRAALADRLGALLTAKKLPELVTKSFLRDYYDVPIPTTDMPVLTDDYAPVDMLPVYGWEPEHR